jgi:RNA polymerase sigma-70 factor (ECF subfamily)
VDADDIVQSVFCAFFEAARRGLYDVPDGEDLWRLILVIALNKVRAKRVFHRAAKRDVRLTAPADCLQSQWQPDDDLPARLLRIAFEDALEQLDDPQRKMVDLLLEGHEVAEIAGDPSQAEAAPGWGLFSCPMSSSAWSTPSNRPRTGTRTPTWPISFPTPTTRTSTPFSPS